jgi:hypothetical protein
LRDSKKVLCEKTQFDIEINMGKDYDERVVENKVFVDFRKEEKKSMTQEQVHAHEAQKK